MGSQTFLNKIHQQISFLSCLLCTIAIYMCCANLLLTLMSICYCVDGTLINVQNFVSALSRLPRMHFVSADKYICT